MNLFPSPILEHAPIIGAPIGEIPNGIYIVPAIFVYEHTLQLDIIANTRDLTIGDIANHTFLIHGAN